MNDSFSHKRAKPRDGDSSLSHVLPPCRAACIHRTGRSPDCRRCGDTLSQYTTATHSVKRDGI